MEEISGNITVYLFLGSIGNGNFLIVKIKAKTVENNKIVIQVYDIFVATFPNSFENW